MIILINITTDTYPLKLISKKLKLLEMKVDNKLKLAHELQININKKTFSFKFQTLLLYSLFSFRTF